LITKEKRYGWWSNHPYTRRSIRHNFFKRLEPDELLSTMNRLDQMTKRLFATTYETGGRAQEVLSLKPEQFTVDNNIGIVIVNRMLVEKLRDVEDKSRTFPVLLSSPYTKVMMEAVNDTEMGERIFPYGRHWMYKKFCAIDREEGEKHGPWWIHRVRAEKATSLVLDHGFGVLELMKFFNMQKTETPTFYAKLSPQDLINKILKGEV
jgi:integrase